jgi:poly(beta-D-mannuronate) lyase
MKRQTLLVLIVLLATVAVARAQTTRPVASVDVDKLRDAIKSAKPGDTVAIPAGYYHDVEISLDAKGERNKPVTLRAAERGKAIFTGMSSIRIAGKHLIVDGVSFAGPTTTRTPPISFAEGSERCRLTNSSIVDFTADLDNRFQYIRVGGTAHRIDHCELAGKTNMGPMLAANGGTRVRIDHNLFRDFPHVPRNGREVIQVIGIGSNDEPLEAGGGYWVIENNLFLRAHGEGAEIISLKSNHNVVRHNTVRATKGAFTMRSGGGNTFDGNLVFGDGMEGTGGLRISGREAKAINNYIDGVSGTAIQLHAGEYIESDISGGYEPLERKGAPLGRVAHYLPLKDGAVANNIVVGTTGTELVYGSGYGNGWPKQQMIVLPDNLVLERNVFVARGDPSRVMLRLNLGIEHMAKLPDGAKPRAVKGRDNFLFGAAPSVAPLPENFGFRREDPKLVDVDGLSLPAADSPAIAAGFDPKPLRSARPLTEADVGPQR